MAADRVRLDRPQTLLLQACLLPDAQALAAWREWEALRPFEEVSGAEVRLLAPLAARLATLDPGSTLLPRIRGIARARWTMAQLALRAAGEAAALLADMPVLIFGAAATHAEDLGPAVRREITSVDLLVPDARFAAAAARMCGDGWISTDGASAALVATAAPLRHRIRFLKATHGDVTVWRVPFARCREDATALGALWRDARPGTLAGRPVLVPQATDAVLIALAQGGAGGGWALEVVERARRQTLDWARLVEASQRWRLSPEVAPRLGTLIADLGLALDPDVRRRLAADRPDLIERSRDLASPGGIVRRWARRMLAARGYIAPPDDAAGVPVVRARRSSAPPMTWSHALRQSLVGGAGRLLLGFPADAIGRPFRIEASRDGVALALIRGRVRTAVHAVAWLGGAGPLDLEARPPAVERGGFGRDPAPTVEPVPFYAWRG